MAESCGAPTKRKVKPPNLTIQQYIELINTDKQPDLTVDHLNQIIQMHGFKKIHRTNKGILLEVVGKMDLMNPTRSTIQDGGVTSDAILSLEDVINDLNDLKWQECCVTSLQTLNAVNHLHQQGSLDSGGCSVGTIASASSEKQPRKTRRRPRKLADIGTLTPRLNTGSSETLPSTPAVENWSPRKKRAVKYVNAMGCGVGVTSPVAAACEVQQLPSSAIVASDS